MRSGQGSTEFLLLLAFILLLILPAGYYIFTQSSESSRVIQAELAVREIAKTVDYVYYQAPGAKQTVTVFIPAGINWAASYVGHPTDLGGKELNLAVYTQTGQSTDVMSPTKGEVRGSWPDSDGNYRFEIRKTSAGYVLLSPYKLTFLLDPQAYTAYMQATNTTSFTLTATELDNAPRTLSLVAGGGIADWLSLGTASLKLSASGTNSTSVSITVPETVERGIYTGEIDASDGEITDTTYITVIVTGVDQPPIIFNPENAIEVTIIEPENTTYYTLPLNLTYTVNTTFIWCGYSLDEGNPLAITGNTTLFVTGGYHHVEVFCVSEGGGGDLDDQWFTVSVPQAESAYTCFDLDPIRAYNNTYKDVLSLVTTSDDQRAASDLTFGILSFINVDWGLSFPGEASSLIIHSLNQTIEHYETSSQLDALLQWQLTNGWGATVCSLPIRQANPGAEANDSCALIGQQAMENPGQNEVLSTRLFYLPHASSLVNAYMDWTRVNVCYGEKMKWINILSPTANQVYNVDTVWFNITSNAWINYAWYSLDGGANTSMTPFNITDAYKQVTMGIGNHTVVFYANDSRGNIATNTTQFSTVSDTHAPEITLTSPLNQTYRQNWVWVNATTNENAGWCGYSKDGGANTTMSGSGTSWYANATGFSQASHNVKAYCNDTVGNMGVSSAVYFTINSLAPQITIASPANSTYTTRYLWFNITLDETGNWTGYSLDGAANVTLSGSNMTWYKSATVANGTHTVTFYANDSDDNLGTSTRQFTVNVCNSKPRLWELDRDLPQPVDFTNGLNSTANTFGPAGASDGWDWGSDSYSAGSTCVHFNTNKYINATSPSVATIVAAVNTSDALVLQIGDYAGCGNPGANSSGAYGVRFTVTADQYEVIRDGANVTLSFNWSFTNAGLDNNEDAWVKARFGNTTAMTYLGTQVGGGNDDATADIMYQQNPGSTSGSFSQNVKTLITASGEYYLDAGAKVRAWSSNNEHGVFTFDNIDLVIGCP